MRGRFPLLLRKAVRRLGHELTRASGVHYETSFLVEILHKHGVSLVIDVGANAGQWASELRRAGYEGRIVSFEPVSSCYARLHAAAQGDPAWTVAPRMAIADFDGEATIHVASNTPMSSLLRVEEHTLRAVRGSATVSDERTRVARLDSVLHDFASEDDLVFLKVDTQGSEEAVLSGASASLGRLKGLQLELSLLPLYEREATALTLYNRLAEFGLVPVLFVPGFYSPHLARQLQVDCVFVREDPR